MYAIYDMENSEMCIGIFKKRKEVAEFLGVSQNSIGSDIHRKCLAKRRYLIEKINIEEE